MIGSNFFHSEDTIKQTIIKGRFLGDYGHPFIDFSKIPDYQLSPKVVNFSMKGQLKKLVLPYEEIIDFISHPNSKINIKSRGSYQMHASLKSLTETNLSAFLAERPNSFNGKILRLASLSKNENDTWNCSLETATYFDQIRTNLSIDFPLPDKDEKSLRKLDQGEKTNRLPSFHNSKLVNSIGVAAVVTYYSKEQKKRFYFLRKRAKQTSIYGDLLSTIGGVIEPSQSTFSSLIDLASAQMENEFFLETGYSRSNYSIHPLALCRDLFRGGKPQFFFLIEIPEISEDEFKHGFEHSKEGNIEFQSTSNFGSEPLLSPATMANFSYTLAYFQSKMGLNK